MKTRKPRGIPIKDGTRLTASKDAFIKGLTSGEGVPLSPLPEGFVPDGETITFVCCDSPDMTIEGQRFDIVAESATNDDALYRLTVGSEVEMRVLGRKLKLSVTSIKEAE